MARTIVTCEAVAAAAEALAAIGEEPGIIAVQAAIGAGSFTTVKKHLDQWKAQRQAQPVAIRIPDSLATQGQALIGSLWQAATQLAGEEVEQVRRDADERLTQTRSELSEALAVIERLEADLEAQAQQIATLTSDRDVVQRDAETAAQQMTLLEAQLAELRAEFAETRVAVGRMAHLEGENAVLREQLAALLQRLPTPT